ncbi:MAG: hypothetical protein IKP00_02395 [Victivallales bacterium]|nr:hypothetical protein [Victivallales bacterium]
MAILFLFWLAMMLLATTLLAFQPSLFLKNKAILTGITVFVLSAIFFHYKHFPSIYVFGHELTHWVTAKLFFKKTGHIRIHRLSGSTEIYNPNIAITLAPYIIPFYLMVVVGAFGLSQLFVFPSPIWTVHLVSALLGLTYAYHIMLNIYALRNNQTDVEVYGKVLSYAFILSGNTLFLLLAMLITTSQWKEAARAFMRLLSLQLDALKAIASAFLKVS